MKSHSGGRHCKFTSHKGAGAQATEILWVMMNGWMDGWRKLNALLLLTVLMMLLIVSLSGEHLRVCPQGYTCCTSGMEENLLNLSRREFETQVKESGRTLQASLSVQFKSFDGELLSGKRVSLSHFYKEIKIYFLLL